MRYKYLFMPCIYCIHFVPKCVNSKIGKGLVDVLRTFDLCMKSISHSSRSQRTTVHLIGKDALQVSGLPPSIRSGHLC
jgi:hypothetical protein